MTDLNFYGLRPKKIIYFLLAYLKKLKFKDFFYFYFMEKLGDKKVTPGDNLVAKSCNNNFYCITCDYLTSRKSSFDKHILTLKHTKVTLGDKKLQKVAKSCKIVCNYCNKEFTSRNGLWKHKKNCCFIKPNHNSQIQQSELDINYLSSLVLEVVKNNNNLQKQNYNLQNKVLDICKNNTINNNNFINSNNKTFNLQVFLNETCKNAMNITDFIESIKLQVSDLENVGKVGYIEGISDIIIKNLQALDIEKRPVHCTDQKREVIYVKEDNIWEKEDESNKKLRKAIRMIAHKNICMLKEFREKYPDCEDYDSNKNSQYNKIVIEAMGGKGDDDYIKNSKIIKKIAKVVSIDKS